MSSAAQVAAIRSNPKLGDKQTPFLTVRLLAAIGNFAETRQWWLFAVVSELCGWGRARTMITRHLDHDELFTFYIAQASNLRHVVALSQSVDLQPPLSYLIVRISFGVFGASPWSCRLPSLIAYCATSALLFYFLGKLLRPVYGLIAVLLLWSTPYAYLAQEARPYAMLLCFSTLMMVCWYQLLAEGRMNQRSKKIAILVLIGFGILLSHVLGLLIYAAFFGAELLRCSIRRKPEWRLWVALAVPLVSVVTYIPLLRNHATIQFASEYRATPLGMLSFYWESLRFVTAPLALIGFLAALSLLRGKNPPIGVALSRAITAPFGFLLVSFSLVPLVTAMLFAHTGTAFFDRYGVVWLVPLSIVPTLILAKCTQNSQLAGTVIALLLAIALFFNTGGKPWLVENLSAIMPPRAAARLIHVLSPPPLIPVHNPPVPPYLQAEVATAPVITHLDAINPELPLVANTGFTFMEVDREESAQVAQRLYMLTDEEAASAIAHDTVFAHYQQVKEAFPAIRGKVEEYCTFVSQHAAFLVIGAYNNPQGWLLRKLQQDGAELRVVGKCRGNTEDCQIYKVKLRSQQCQPTASREMGRQ